jgi:hypothetical protein
MLDPQHLTTVCASLVCYEDGFSLLYVGVDHTSQEIYLWASTTFNGVSFTVLYVDDDRTSQELRGFI